MSDYHYRMSLRWGDMDAMRHINNTVYFRYFEQARIAWLEQFGLLGEASAEGPILASVSCNFLKPLTYPGDIIVHQVVTKIGTSSITMDLSIVREDEPHLVYARGASVMVWMDYAKGRAAPWPKALRDRLVTSNDTTTPVEGSSP
jgi:acyl-CoA thioester hydrolase